MTTSPRIAVVDYGAGNLRSVSKALVRSGFAPTVTADPEALARADAVLLPGVGAFADGMVQLRARGLDEAVLGGIESGKPYLGLCLGLQLLFDEGLEHGTTPGLGVLGGRVVRFPDLSEDGSRRLVPHIGWNKVTFGGAHPICQSLENEAFYFVHSFHAEPAHAKDVAGTADYGGTFTAAIARDNVFAVQCHPEKSQVAGKRLLDAFREWMITCV